MSYTSAALLAVALTVVLDLFVLRTRLLTRKVFWTAYGIIVFFQLITNGVLTGRGIVFYDGDAIIGSSSTAGQAPQLLGDGRIVFAPFEDLLFGFALVVQTLAWWVWWGRRVDR
ncbi:MAG: lycopene cyclase domain-containing protein [Frankiaceae bacterium]|nr:lycopene cyclase domain-containing protein [Frankiaceae bacterium]